MFYEIVNNLSEEMNDLYIGYSIYPDRTTSPGHYVLFVETANPVSDEKKEKYSETFEKMLCKGNFRNPAFDSGRIGSLPVPSAPG